jgi:hypothetical protein
MRFEIKKPTYGAVIKRIIREMAKKAWELKVIKHTNLGITKNDDAKEDKKAFVGRAESVVMHLYKIHSNNDVFMTDIACVPKEDASKPTSSGWYRIFRDHKAEIDAKVARLNTKNQRTREEGARMDEFVKNVQKLSLQRS